MTTPMYDCFWGHIRVISLNPIIPFPNLCRFSYIPTHAILPCFYATFDMLRNDWCAGGFPQLWFKKNKDYYIPGYYWFLL